MANEQLLISSIETSVRKLIVINDKLKSENLNLHQHIKNLDNDIERLKNELEIKRNDLFKITLANTLKTENSVEDSKEKIDELIVEIDRCIEVLSE
jgi:predicted RNase H-like nuclease (RuvC/YqgF family)